VRGVIGAETPRRHAPGRSATWSGVLRDFVGFSATFLGSYGVLIVLRLMVGGSHEIGVMFLGRESRL